MAVRQAPSETGDRPADRLLVYAVEYEAGDGDDWRPAGWFRAFVEAMRVASAFERARVRLVEL